MIERLLVVLAFASAVGGGLVGGVFLAFSSFVMRALGRLPPPAGIAAMQSINVTVINPVFLGVFLGTALTCLAVVVLALVAPGAPARPHLIGAGLLYVVGSLGVTLALNVPLNDALAAADPASAVGADLWARYLARWTAWNHVRALASAGAAAWLTAALRASS